MTPVAAILFTLKTYHPERSLGVSHTYRQTEWKDPYPPASPRDETGNFRAVVRFFDDHETECPAIPGREAVAWESPAPFDLAQGRLQCRVALQTKNESLKDVTLRELRHQ